MPANDPILAATLSECARQEKRFWKYREDPYECPVEHCVSPELVSAAHLFVHLTQCPHYQALFVTPDPRPHSLKQNES